jgi:hypothetical protein
MLGRPGGQDRRTSEQEGYSYEWTDRVSTSSKRRQSSAPVQECPSEGTCSRYPADDTAMYGQFLDMRCAFACHGVEIIAFSGSCARQLARRPIHVLVDNTSILYAPPCLPVRSIPGGSFRHRATVSVSCMALYRSKVPSRPIVSRPIVFSSGFIRPCLMSSLVHTPDRAMYVSSKYIVWSTVPRHASVAIRPPLLSPSIFPVIMHMQVM